MKYIAIFDDNMLSNFRLDDDRLTLVLVDKSGSTRAVRLKPIIRPILTVTEDCGGSATNSIYLTEGHINAMKDYEARETIKEFLGVSGEVNDLYREETCERKAHCYNYEYWHCIGCHGCKADVRGGKT